MIWVRWGSALMFAAVALGAFGAHGLKTRVSPEMLAVFETGVRYHMVHALALLALGWLSTVRPSGLTQAAGALFVSGIFVFSGSLYVLALTGTRGWGAVTPVGGLLFLIGWLAFFGAAFRA